MEFSVPKAGFVTVGDDGFYVVLKSDNKVIPIPWNAALEVAREMIIKARKIEETVKANQITADQALLIRLGVPLGLTNNPDIKKEAFKDAQYDPKLRKYITGARVKGIPSGEVVGTPTFVQHPPKGGNNGLQ